MRHFPTIKQAINIHKLKITATTLCFFYLLFIPIVVVKLYQHPYVIGTKTIVDETLKIMLLFTGRYVKLSCRWKLRRVDLFKWIMRLVRRETSRHSIEPPCWNACIDLKETAYFLRSFHISFSVPSRTFSFSSFILINFIFNLLIISYIVSPIFLIHN